MHFAVIIIHEGPGLYQNQNLRVLANQALLSLVSDACPCVCLCVCASLYVRTKTEKLHYVSKKTSPTFLAITRESIDGFL